MKDSIFIVMKYCNCHLELVLRPLNWKNFKIKIDRVYKMKEYKCKHCEGISLISILNETEKATLPAIEFCPFCGM